MKIAAIIAEYNPYHNGHRLLVRQVRSAGAQAVIAVMGGDWLQRGEPALFPKRIRARAALTCGVDLVLELPLPYAAATAERFAWGAVFILSALGCVDTLAFGSECGELPPLERCQYLPHANMLVQHDVEQAVALAPGRLEMEPYAHTGGGPFLRRRPAAGGGGPLWPGGRCPPGPPQRHLGGAVPGGAGEGGREHPALHHPPPRGRARQRLSLRGRGGEAPHRLRATLDDLLAAFGDRRIALCRELTKLHEDVARTTLAQAAAWYRENEPRGEYVLALAGAERRPENAVTLAQGVELVLERRERGERMKDAVRQVSADTGLGRNELYEAALLASRER